MKIWVDDLRPAPDGWVWCKTSVEALNLLEQLHLSYSIPNEPPEIVSLDHDLGGEDTTRPIVIWMIENNFWPVEVRCHSANPVGYDWITSMIDRYKPTEKD